jgi:hypothetical protein
LSPIRKTPSLTVGLLPRSPATNAFLCRKMRVMSLTDDLEAKLRALDTEFDREMRARGFDPVQAENIALPAHLAKLYAEREQIKAELQALEGRTDD